MTRDDAKLDNITPQRLAMFATASTTTTTTTTMATMATRARAQSYFSTRARAGGRARGVVAVVAAGAGAGGKTLQLGTAKLPSAVDVAVFEDAMFQWATTLTTNGQNLPFVLPQRVDRIDGGFSMEFLMSNDANEFEAIAAVRTAVEEIPGDDSGARAFIITGTGRIMDLVDTPVVMGSMPAAIRAAVAAASP